MLYNNEGNEKSNDNGDRDLTNKLNQSLGSYYNNGDNGDNGDNGEIKNISEKEKKNSEFTNCNDYNSPQPISPPFTPCVFNNDSNKLKNNLQLPSSDKNTKFYTTTKSSNKGEIRASDNNLEDTIIIGNYLFDYI